MVKKWLAIGKEQSTQRSTNVLNEYAVVLKNKMAKEIRKGRGIVMKTFVYSGQIATCAVLAIMVLGVSFAIAWGQSHETRTSRVGGTHLKLRKATEEETNRAALIDSSFQMTQESSGLRFVQIAELPSNIVKDNTTFSVPFVDAEAGIDDLLGLESEPKRFDLIIDGERISKLRPAFTLDTGVQAFHDARLRLGKHTVVIKDPEQGDKVLYDGDILVNGVDDVRLTIERCRPETGNQCVVVVRSGLAEIFRSS